jgi:uncharacterized protein with FMN-binding domain
MKKILTIALFFGLMLTLSACGKDAEYYDGTFTGRSDVWQFGHEQADVRFEDNEIVEITLKRIWTDGTEVDYSLFDGTNPDGKPNLKQYRLDLAEDMMTSDDPTDVDAISGATVSSDGWIEAVERAMEKAKK